MAKGVAWDKDKAIELITPFLGLGMSVTKSCEMAGIPQSTVQTWIDNDELLRLKVTSLRNKPNVKALENWNAKLDEGDYTASKEWLERRMKEVFSTKSESEVKLVTAEDVVKKLKSEEDVL
jgi:hypothetical protein